MGYWQHIKNCFRTKPNTTTKMKFSQLYRFDTSSSVNANLRAPLNGAAMGTVTFYQPVKLKRITVQASGYLNDSVAGSWNAPARGLVNITGSAIFGNASAFGLSVSVMNEGQESFDITLPAGTYTITGTLGMIPYMHPVFDPTSAGPVWQTCTVDLSCMIEVENID